jgi:hypothetical protein
MEPEIYTWYSNFKIFSKLIYKWPTSLEQAETLVPQDRPAPKSGITEMYAKRGIMSVVFYKLVLCSYVARVYPTHTHKN